MAANLTSFGVSILMTYPASVSTNGNPIQALTYQAVAPWGKSSAAATINEAISDVFQGKGGTPWTGKMGQFFSAQTLNGSSTSGGPTAYFTANEVGSP